MVAEMINRLVIKVVIVTIIVLISQMITNWLSHWFTTLIIPWMLKAVARVRVLPFTAVPAMMVPRFRMNQRPTRNSLGSWFVVLRTRNRALRTDWRSRACSCWIQRFSNPEASLRKSKRKQVCALPSHALPMPIPIGDDQQ